MKPIKFLLTLCFMLLTSMTIAKPLFAANVITDISKPIILKAKQSKFTIQLKANPTTGYQWFLSHYNPKFIQPVRYQYQPGNKKLIGSPGVASWTFKLTRLARKVPSVVTFTLTYARGWEFKQGETYTVYVITV